MIGVGQMRTIRATLALALALAGGGVFAQSVQVADSAFQRFLINTTGVGQQTVGFTGTGQPIPQVSSHALAPDGSPNVRATATGVLRNQAGGQIPVSVAGRITPAVVARFIGRATPLLAAAIIASDIADFASEQGFQLGYSDGAVTVRKPDPQSCASNCFTYTGVVGVIEITSGTIGGFCSAYRAGGNSYGNPQWFLESIVQSPEGCYFRRQFTSGSVDYVTVTPNKTSRQPDPNPFQPSSVAEFEQYLLQGNPYPVSSSVAEAIAQAREVLNEPIPLAQPEVTGPASSPGSTSTTTKPDGSTVTITQTFNHTYNGPNISTTTTTTTSTVPAGGGPVQTETTVQTPDPVQQEPEPFTMPCGIAGTPPCAVKVDETGVPTEVAELADTQKLADQSTAPIDRVEDPSFWPSRPEVTFDFALPTACSPLSIPAFAPFLEQIDVCEFQPMFHSIMELVWILGALFGAIGLFWRNSMNPVPA